MRCSARFYGAIENTIIKLPIVSCITFKEKGQTMTKQEANTRMTQDLRLVMRDAEDLLKATAGQAGERVTEIRQRLAGALESAKATRQRLQNKTVEAAKATDRVIRQHPYESLGVALGTGLLIGVLVAWR
jgi:ElaB/YqjD/DUF883 family membrane-anchored ribosome-binding protein